MFHMQKRQLLLSSLFKKPVHNAIRHFSCSYFFSRKQALIFYANCLFNFFQKTCFGISCKLSPKEKKYKKISSVCHLLNLPREC